MNEFLKAALVNRQWHASGTLEQANALLEREPQLGRASIYTAAVLGDEAGVRDALSHNPGLATAKGGPYGWDALSHLCFSRYLRLQPERSGDFVRTARLLLEAGADANTGWYEKDDFEAAIYGAAGFAQNPELTRLLLEFGADPNDGETPYHTPESYDNTTLQVLLESGKLSEKSKVIMLIRKADIHDEPGMRLVLEHGGDPNAVPVFGFTAFQHAIRRGNRLPMFELLLDHGADPSVENSRDGRSGAQVAARIGRGDVLNLLEKRGIPYELDEVETLIAACAKGHRAQVNQIVMQQPGLRNAIQHEDGGLLAEFAGTGNVEGVHLLLDLGVAVDARYTQIDGYWGIGKETTALHMAAWRARPEIVKLLLQRGTSANSLDGMGQTPLALAVRACVDSHWIERRSAESVKALLAAGATLEGVSFPCGYEEVDVLLREAAEGARA